MMNLPYPASVPTDRLAPFTDQLRLAAAAYHDRACTNLDRHPNYVLAAYMASGT
jgi:hypothetical protein